MPTDDSSDHNIVLHAAHEKQFDGYQTTVPCGTAGLDLPHTCGCISSFAPAGYKETGDDGVTREVWRQVAFKFKEYVSHDL